MAGGQKIKFISLDLEGEADLVQMALLSDFSALAGLKLADKGLKDRKRRLQDRPPGRMHFPDRRDGGGVKGVNGVRVERKTDFPYSLVRLRGGGETEVLTSVGMDAKGRL